MAESVMQPNPAATARRMSLGERLRRNPITLKEMRSRVRGRRAYVILTFHAGLLSAVVSLIYAAYTASPQAGSNPRDLQALGKIIFSVVVGLQLLLMCFVSPSLTVGAISSEREWQTYDLLRTTLLSARELVLGKLMSALLFVGLLLLAAIPVQSLAFLFGGVTLEEILIGTAMLIVTAFTFSSIGLFFSSLARRTLVATALSNGLSVLLVIGLPVLLVVMLSLLAPVLYGFGSSPIDPATQVRLFALQWLIISITPMPAGIATVAMLSSGDGPFIYNLPFNGQTLQFLAPWLTYVIVYTLLGAILLWFSIRFVKRAEK